MPDDLADVERHILERLKKEEQKRIELQKTCEKYHFSEVYLERTDKYPFFKGENHV